MRAVCSTKDVERAAEVVFFPIAIPAPIRIGIRELSLATALPVTAFAALAKEFTKGACASFNGRAISYYTECLSISKQSLVCRGCDELNLEQLLE
ncbi:hypothetical protein D3C84_1094960 [compost metagenome]